MPEPAPPTGRTDHASKLASSHAGEHGRRYRLSLEFGAADDRQAHRLGFEWAQTAAAEWNTCNPIVIPMDGDLRTRLLAQLDAEPLYGIVEVVDAVVAALPELATCTALCRDVEHERDELAAEATRLREQLAAAQSTDLEGDVRDHLHGLADWDTPNGAAPEWLVDAVMGFVAPHVCARKQAEAERDTAQAAITRVRALCDEYADEHTPDWRPLATATAKVFRAALDGEDGPLPRGLFPPAALTPPSARHLLDDLTAEAIDAGTYDQPAPQMRPIEDTPASAPESPATAPTPPHPTHEPHQAPGSPHDDRQ